MIDCPPAFDDLRLETIFAETEVLGFEKTLWTINEDVPQTLSHEIVTPTGWVRALPEGRLAEGENLPADGKLYPLSVFVPRAAVSNPAKVPVKVIVWATNVRNNGLPTDSERAVDQVANPNGTMDALTIEEADGSCVLQMARSVPSVSARFYVTTQMQGTGSFDLFALAGVLASVSFTPTFELQEK